jgi:hypothetical protein
MWCTRVRRSFLGLQERGARNSLLLLNEEERKRGVMAASAGVSDGGEPHTTIRGHSSIMSRAT